MKAVNAESQARKPSVALNTPQIIYAGKYLRFVKQDGWEFVQRCNISGIIAILAVTDDRKIILVEQYRVPVAAPVIEIPAGLVGDRPGSEKEDVIEAAKRELEEETGYRAKDMTLLTSGAASAGLGNEIIALYRATGLTRVGDGGGDEHENITVHEVHLFDAEQWLQQQARAGKIIDLKVYAALYFALRGQLA